MAYDHISLEQKWQRYWNDHQTYTTPNPPFAPPKPKKYILDMFPYPSGAGLHVGHPKGYTATDIVSRYYHAKGYNVLHPMGFDAFGLPAENYAIKTGTHPAITTAENIKTFISQLKSLGFSYDWDRMVDTTDPAYYQWTQWIFLELFRRGLAYEQDLPINYCPSCKTGLANEEVLADNTCDRCGTRVERRPIRQWVLRITEYAERLLSDIDDLDWPDGIKEMQRNWIGKSEGCEFEMRKSDDPSKSIRVYTTRIDTVYGMTYAVLAPDHPKVDDFITSDQRSACEAYIEAAKGKSDQDRTADNKEKTGVFTGSFVINPYNGEAVPLWIADYVLGHYGTGAVMAVPAHDERDFSFATKYDLPIKQSIAPYVVYTGNRTPKKDAETLERTTTIAFVEYEGKFLLAKEQNQYMICIGGGLDEGETPLDAIKREMIEETGFYDFESITPVMNTELYADSYSEKRGKNIVGYDSICFHIKLKSLDTHSVSNEERSARELFWFEKDEIAEKLDWITHQIQWKQFIKPSVIAEDGYLVNSSEYNKISSSEARRVLTEKAEKEGFGVRKVNYKLRDWLFSRQRYWGEPIPLIHISHEDYEKLEVTQSEVFSESKPDTAYRVVLSEDEEWLYIGGYAKSRIYDGINGKIIIEENLPLKLPEVERYEPAGDGQSPLATVPTFVNVRLAENLVGKRETNTMPQWGGSCWYYLRYMDPRNPDALASKEALDYWGIVDEYVGGAEHAVLHLLYARFWHKVLYDAGVVPTKEPFQKLTNVGMILAYAYERADGGLVAVDLVEERDGKFFEKETGKEVKQVVAKMSKSLKNVINPNDIVREYGADTLRLYEMSMSGFTDTAPWNPDAIIGVRRFLDRAHATFTEGKNVAKDEMKAMKLLHKTVKKVGEDIVEYKFNTAISSLMILLNEGLPTDPEFVLEWKEKFAIMLHPFAPHMAEELWSLLPLDKGGRGDFVSIYHAPWPEYDEWMLVDDEVTIAVQVNGKLRGTLTCMNGVMQEEVSTLAHENPDIAKWLEGKTLVKEIYIPNKMLSIVVKDL